ncbi:trehalose-6-phosphate synthase, partial [Thalassiosira pseudonana CCMP1335]
ESIFIVCYHLPVILTRDPDDSTWTACWSESLIAKSETHGVSSTRKTTWIGTVSNIPAQFLADENEREAIRVVLKDMDCIPIFFVEEGAESVSELHYLGFCKQVLWPSFHNLQSDWGDRLDRWWNAYQFVNRKFSKVVAELVEGGDIVWVHDYHLALMPRMLREARNETKMVFFIHVPFPTSQVFRELEHGEALLEGMLHADVVGFHAFDHARHFLNAAKRILGLGYESLMGGLIGVRHRGTKVLVTVSNVSVETDIVDALMSFPSVQDDAEALRQKHEGRTIIAGIDVAQRLSGVSLKLLAFERLLTDYPVWQSKVVLLQRCLIPGNRRVDEADTLREVRFLVKKIEMKFGAEGENIEWIVLGSVMPIDQRLSIWRSSQVALHTPIREGLNLGPLEYVYARKEPSDPGVVIASEFSAVSSVLNGALRVNPFDVQMCVTSIDCALSMTMNERDARRGRDIDFVSTCPSGLWTRNVLRDLNDATHDDSIKMKSVGDGTPEAILARELELGLERLDVRALESAYAETKKRVIIIDFNGTLVAKEAPGNGFKPSPIAAMALSRLAKDPLNTVYVVSGDSQHNLEIAVGDIPGLGLAASNGACFADPGGRERTWQYLDFGVDWNEAAMPIISKYTARTNGSFVKLTHASIGWSYYSADPEWGSLQSSHLVPELGEALQSFDVRFVALKGIVEVVPRKLNKGHIVKKILEDAQTRNKAVDFVLCMGDDIADEKMFTSVMSFSAESHCQGAYAFNVAVGKKATNASFYIDDASDVADVLVAL